jgi:hypothetical protein
VIDQQAVDDTVPAGVPAYEHVPQVWFEDHTVIEIGGRHRPAGSCVTCRRASDKDRIHRSAARA